MFRRRVPGRGRSTGEDVLEADVEGGVGVGGEGVTGFAGDVAGAGVVVAYCVFDLEHHITALAIA